MKLGRWGEAQARLYLEGLGYSILTSNYFTRYGELDIIATQADVLVFVEVKTRSNNAYGFGEDAIHQRKLSALQNSIAVYFEKEAARINNWRLDLIVVEGKLGQPDPAILHYENIGAES